MTSVGEEIEPEDFGLSEWPRNRLSATVKKNIILSKIQLTAEYFPKDYANFIIITVIASIKRGKGDLELVLNRMMAGRVFTDRETVVIPLDNPIRLRKGDHIYISILLSIPFPVNMPIPVIQICPKGKVIEVKS